MSEHKFQITKEPDPNMGQALPVVGVLITQVMNVELRSLLIFYGYRDEDYFFTLIRYLALPSSKGESPNFP